MALHFREVVLANYLNTITRKKRMGYRNGEEIWGERRKKKEDRRQKIEEDVEICFRGSHRFWK